MSVHVHALYNCYTLICVILYNVRSFKLITIDFILVLASYSAGQEDYALSTIIITVYVFCSDFC